MDAWRSELAVEQMKMMDGRRRGGSSDENDGGRFQARSYQGRDERQGRGRFEPAADRHRCRGWWRRAMLDTPGARNAVEESPTFVHTRDNYDDDNVSHAMTAEQGYKFGYTSNPSYGDDANNNQLPRTPHSAMPSPPFNDDYKIDDQDLFPRYTPKAGVERPTYERLEGTRQSRENNNRGYYVGDTVEF